MVSIPTNGEDPWGDEIRSFLLAVLNTDGTLKSAAVRAITDALYDADGDAAAASASAYAAAIQRANHTGSQAQSTVTGLVAALAAKADTSSLGTAAALDSGTGSGNVPVLGASGTLSVARLATGTPDSTKFARGDGTWAVPAGGGGGGASDAVDVTFDPAGTDFTAVELQELGEEIDVRFVDVQTAAVNEARAGVALLPDITNVIAASATNVTTTPGTGEQDLIALPLEHGYIAGGVWLEYVFSGDLLSNSGAPNFTFKAKLGATTILDTGATAIAVDTNRRKWECRGMVYVPPADVAHEECSSGLWITAPTAGSTALISGLEFGAEVDATEDFASDKTLKMTVTMSVNNAAVQTVCKRAVVRRITPAA